MVDEYVAISCEVTRGLVFVRKEGSVCEGLDLLKWVLQYVRVGALGK